IFSVMDEIFEVVSAFYNLSEKAGIDNQSFSAVIKIIGIGYIAEFCNSVCVDANCKTLGDKVLFASKIAIVLVALPAINQLLSLLMGLLQ
ncbi:MAG: hypothetical protein NC350_06540, partial [Corallococcus sp.]|nr:hypothetical protein [Corallococcus sp.]